MSLKDQVFATEDVLETQPIEVDAWPEGLFARKISGAEVQKRDAILRDLGEDDYPLKMVTWIISCTVDADGNNVFDNVPDEISEATLKEENDITKLLRQPIRRLEKATDVILKLNELRAEDEEESKKNLEQTRTNNGGTSSPEQSSELSMSSE